MTANIQPNPLEIGVRYEPSTDEWLPDYHPGAIAWDAHGKAYCWVRASAAVKQYDFCPIDPSTDFDCAPVVAANSIRNYWGGIAPIAVPAGRWFWLQRVGKTLIRITGGAAAANSQVRTNAALTDAAAPGRMTTANSTGNDFVIGVGIVGTPSAATLLATIDGILNWPAING